MTFSKRNQPFEGKFHDVLDKIKADMIQFTKKWNVKDTFAEYFCLQISVLHHNISIFKADRSSLRDGWTKCKENVSDVLVSSQNVQTTCNSKVKFIERIHRNQFIKREQKN